MADNEKDRLRRIAKRAAEQVFENRPDDRNLWNYFMDALIEATDRPEDQLPGAVRFSPAGAPVIKLPVSAGNAVPWRLLVSSVICYSNDEVRGWRVGAPVESSPEANRG